MAKNIAFLVHRETGKTNYTFNKSDLAHLIGVSLRTVMRKYSNVGKYETVDYIIYISDNKYTNDKSSKKKQSCHTIKPNMDNVSHNDINSGHKNTFIYNGKECDITTPIPGLF